MSISKFRDISVAWPIAIKRFGNSKLVKNAPASYWEDDFFVSLAQKVPWEKILREVQQELPNADQKEIDDVFSHVLFSELEEEFEGEEISFKENLMINILKFEPLDDEENELIEKARTLLRCSAADSSLEDADYEIDDMSGTLCGDPRMIQQTVSALSLRNSIAGRIDSNRMLPYEEIEILRSAMDDGRFEAAWNLMVSKYFPLEVRRLTNNCESEWAPKVLEMLKYHPAAVEKEYMRLKARLFDKQKCEISFPSCLKFFSNCVLLRIERADRINKIKGLQNGYLYHFKDALDSLDNALEISDDTVMNTGFILFLQAEYYNRIQDAEIEKLGTWINNNKNAVSLAVAHTVIQSQSELKKMIDDVVKAVEEIIPVGDVEKLLIEEVRRNLDDAKSELRGNFALTLNKINRHPAPAA